MVNGTIVILCLAGVFLSIFLSYKFNLQMGISAAVFAFIIGVLFMGLRVKEVIAMFPTSVFFQVMALSLFFGFGVVNGTMESIAKHLLWSSRKRPYMIVFALAFIGFALGILGCVPPAAGAILAVMGFTIAVPSGVNPLICAAIGYSANAGSFVRWGASGSVINGAIAANGFEAEAGGFTWEICAITIVLSLLVIIAMFFLYKGYKVKSIANLEEPAPFTPEQKKTLIVILCVVILAVVPGILNTLIGGAFLKGLSGFCDIQVLCLIGFIVCKFMNLADQKKVIASVSWNTLLLLSGISMLMSVAVKAGAVDIITTWLSANVAKWLLPCFFCLLGGFLSCFSGGITVVFPMVAPMVPAIVGSSAANPMLLFCATLLGAHFTAMSPFSTGGAVFIGMNRDESISKKLVTGQLLVCLISIIIACIVVTLMQMVMG